MDITKIEVRPISSRTWDDFVSLMRSDSQCNDCWCLNHRAEAVCATGLKAQSKMKFLVDAGKVNGLMAFHGGKAVAWIAIEPMEELAGHDCRATGKPEEWAIHCLFVKDGFRGKGLSKHLIQASVEYARVRGAKLISAFPIPLENRGKFPQADAEFSGRFSTFEQLGFLPAAEGSTEFYQRLELSI